MNALDYNSVTVPAASGGQPGMAQVQSGGVFFYCKQSSSPFVIQFDTATKIPFDQGFKRSVPGIPFETIRFFNSTANAVTILFYVGNGDVDFVGTSSVRIAATYAKGTDLMGGAALASGSSKTFSGYNGTDLRKQITVQNVDANNNTITVQDSAGGALVTLAAGSPPWLHETSGIIVVKNTSAGPVSRVIVSELFYAN